MALADRPDPTHEDQSEQHLENARGYSPAVATCGIIVRSNNSTYAWQENIQNENDWCHIWGHYRIGTATASVVSYWWIVWVVNGKIVHLQLLQLVNVELISDFLGLSNLLIRHFENKVGYSCWEFFGTDQLRLVHQAGLVGNLVC